MDEILKSTAEIIKLTSENDTSRALSTVGLLLVIIGFVAVFYLFDKKPEEITSFQKTITFGVLIWGVVFSIAGPAVTLTDRINYYKKDWKSVVSSGERIEDLKRNKIVSRVMRIVVYDPTTEMDLKIDRLGYLGPKDQRYTFVADYDELKGLTFAEAARLVGTSPKPFMRMSAIIFPTPHVLIPANARGLLKTISSIEAIAKPAQPFDVQQRMSREAWSNIELDNGPEDYAFDNYKEHYDQFCRASTEFRCSGTFTAKTVIGTISKDWDALGFAHTNPAGDVCSVAARQSACDIHNWERAKNRTDAGFGARVFMVQNTAIDEISQRMLIDVSNPEVQMVPYLPEKGDVMAHNGT